MVGIARREGSPLSTLREHSVLRLSARKVSLSSNTLPSMGDSIICTLYRAVQSEQIPATGILPATITESIMQVSSLPASSISALKRLSAVVSAVRVLNEVMPIQQFGVLLEIAKRDGAIGIMEIAKILGMAEASASRLVAALSDLDHKKKPGLFLVETRTDRMDMRRKWCHLTPKGKRLIEQIVNIETSDRG